MHPDHRRRGVGSALYDAADALRRAEDRTTVLGELHLPVGTGDPTTATAGLDFATAMGFATCTTEEHLGDAAAGRPADGRRR